MRIIVMGSSSFALPALKALHEQHDIAAVYTVPPRPAGRGKKMTKSPLHLYAEEHHISVVTPLSLKNIEEQEKFASFKADVAVVAAYGLILPESILNTPTYGCLNIHASILPKLRGASPIHHAIIEGLTETGVTIMLMDKGLDTGDIISIETCPIDVHATTPQLEEKLAHIGAKMILNTMTTKAWQHATPQNHTQATLTTKIVKTDGYLDFNQSATILERRIRAFRTWPTCYFTYQGETIKVRAAEVLQDTIAQEHQNLTCGTIVDDKLTILCKDGYLRPLLLQRPSKNPVSREDFCNGFTIPPMTTLNM